MKKIILNLIFTTAMLLVIPNTVAQGPLPIELGFEDVEDFLSWTMVDCASGSHRTDEMAREGNYCFVFQGSIYSPQYLISPQFDQAYGTEILSMWYNIYSPSFPEVFSVGFSTTTSDTSAFIWGPTVYANQIGWHEYRVAVPINAQYVAIRGMSHQPVCSLYIDDIFIGEEPACHRVHHLGVSASTDSSLTLSWIDTLNQNVTYSVYLFTDAYTISIANGISETSYTIENLTPNTEYTFGILSDCANESSMMTLVSGRTACAARQTPFIERFLTRLDITSGWVGCLNVTAAEVFAGAALTLREPSAWNLWNYVGAGFMGNEHYYAQVYGTNSSKWLITPPIDLTHVDSAQLTFDIAFLSGSGYATYNAEDSSLAFMVLVSIDGGQTWVDSNAVKWQNFVGQHPLNDICDTNYINQVINLDRYTGNTVRIAFYAQELFARNSSIFHLDNVRVGAPACPTITGLTVSDISGYTALLSWSSNVGAYNIIDMSDNSVVMTVTDTFAMLTGLDPMANYTFGVSALCSYGQSDTIPITFTTDCAPMSLPFVETFDNEINENECWGINNSVSIDSVLAGNKLEIRHHSSSTGWLWIGLHGDYYYHASVCNPLNNGWLITPEFDLSMAGTAQLSFDLRLFDIFGGTVNGYQTDSSIAFVVLISPDGGQSWVDSNTVWWRNFGGQHTLTEIAGTEYINQIVNLNAYVGDTIRIAFYAQGGIAPSGEHCFELNLDNINVSVVPVCELVNHLTVDSIVRDSVWVHWNSTAQAFDIDLWQDTTEVTNASIIVNGTSALIYNLNLNEDYQLRVRSDCDSGTYGEWSEIVGIHTGYCLPSFNLCPGNGIYSVSIGDMTNTANHPTMWPMYADFTSMVGNVKADSIADVCLRFASSSLDVAIWVDWNGNSYFEENEIVYTGRSSNNSYTVLNAGFYVAPERENGQYRMRIISSCNRMYSDPAQANPCGIPSSGWATVAEDYTLAVGLAPECWSVKDLQVDSVTGTSAFLSWTDTHNIGATYSIYDMDSSLLLASNINGTSFEVTGLEPRTNYTFGVAVNCTLENARYIPVVTTRTDCAKGSCFVTIIGHDIMDGMGWAYNAIKIMQDGEIIGSFTFTPTQSIQSFKVCAEVPVDFVWTAYNNYYLNAIGFKILNESGTTVFTVTNATLLTAGTFFTLDSACAPYTFMPDTVLVDISSDNLQQGIVTSNLGNQLPTYVWEGDTITATATPVEGYVFDYWTVTYSGQSNGVTNTKWNNPLQIYVDALTANCSNINIVAHFKISSDSLTVVIVPSVGGTTEPLPGEYHLALGDSIVVYANHDLVCWLREHDGQIDSVFDNPIIVVALPSLLNHTITLTPFFANAIDNTKVSNVIVFSLDGKVIVVGAKGENVNIYDIIGRRVSGLINAGSVIELPVPYAGVYLVRIGSGTKRVVVAR